MVSSDTLLNYPKWKFPFTVHTDSSDKQLSDIISQNDKAIDLSSRKLSNTQRNYTIKDKEIILILECLRQFCENFFV